MIDKVRIYEVATELGITSEEVINFAIKLGMDIKSAQSSITMEQAEYLANYIINGNDIKDKQYDKKQSISKKELDHELGEIKTMSIEKEVNTDEINHIYIQKIYFGMPGTGKSHKVHKEVIPNDLKIDDDDNIISTVFHPEYSYGDFMGKLLPITNAKKDVEYNYYEGFFLKALAKAYKNILHDEKNQNVTLVIDEINRGNSSAIFGTIFQLLDRDDNGWSSYEINISDMEFNKLIDLIFSEKEIQETIGNMPNKETSGLNDLDKRYKAIKKLITNDILKDLLSSSQIKIPPNLSIIGTMNTSDESIYYMDSAFKRRWDWEYINNYWGYDKAGDEVCPKNHIEIKYDNGEEKFFILNELHFDIKINNDKYYWVDFIDNLNSFFIKNSEIIRGVEDKQIGYWFIKAEKNGEEYTISIEKIKNKLMFYIWDSVFSRDKEPLNDLLSISESEDKLKTFGQFQDKTEDFIKAIWSL
jgi:5-methylcytosine-specific restriction enzyme B